jgi:hypothetical protein
VLREGLDHLIGDLPLLGEGAVTGLLEPLEQLLHRLVVFLEHRDCIHRHPATPS